jgi:hypothetical protein
MPLGTIAGLELRLSIRTVETVSGWLYRRGFSVSAQRASKLHLFIAGSGFPWRVMLLARLVSTGWRLPAMNWKKPGAKVVLGLFVLCLSLDILTFFGEQTTPDSVGRTVCKLRLFGFFARFLFPSEWEQYVEQSCVLIPGEPAISIIAFTLKFSLVLLGLIATITMLPLRDNGEDSAEKVPSSENQGQSNGGPTGWIAPLILFVSPTALAWWFIASKSPGDFRGSAVSKVLEDGFLFGCFGAGILVWLAFAEIVLLPNLRRWFPSKSWIRTQ